MNKEVPNRIRLILNELAILNQPEVSNGNFFYQMEVLNRIKALCSELYLLSDLAKSPTGQNLAPPPPPDTASMENLPTELPVEKKVMEKPKPEVVVAQNTAPEVMVNSPVDIGDTEVTEVVESVNNTIHKEANVPTNPKPAGSKELMHEISLTRRFEYANNLFGGSQSEFLRFVDAVSSCSNLESALNFFDKHSAANNWKRKEETASDFRTLVKKWY